MSLGELEGKLLDSSLSVYSKFSIQLQIDKIRQQIHDISVQLVNLIGEDYKTEKTNSYKP